jgi:hypothetical protein
MSLSALTAKGFACVLLKHNVITSTGDAGAAEQPMIEAQMREE